MFQIKFVSNDYFNRSSAGYKAVLRNEKKSDWKTVGQITYGAFRDTAQKYHIGICKGNDLAGRRHHVLPRRCD